MKWRLPCPSALRCNDVDPLTHLGLMMYPLWMDQTCILIRDMTIEALLGIYPHEIGNRQKIIVNVEASLASALIASDRIEDTVSYQLIIDEIRRMSGIQFGLAEKFAEHLADFCLKDKRIKDVNIRVEKPEAFSNCIVGARIYKSS